jgi:hypothetical protein
VHIYWSTYASQERLIIYLNLALLFIHTLHSTGTRSKVISLQAGIRFPPPLKIFDSQLIEHHNLI